MGKFNPQPKQGPKPKKEPKPLKRTAIKKKFKSTGEKHVFQEVLDEVPYDGPTRCFVCGKQISVITHSNFAHILAKGKYPKMRLEPRNIRLLCFNIEGTGCHSILDHQPRSVIINDPKWQPLLKLESELKEEYKSYNP